MQKKGQPKNTLPENRLPEKGLAAAARTGVRINKYLADKGYSSRREADELIKKGMVFLNGMPARLGDRVNTNDSVEVKKSKSEKSGSAKKQCYFIYNKPQNVTLDSSDHATDSLRELSEKSLFPVGRLEKNASGLVVFTNDGRVTRRLLNPSAESANTAHPQEKEYLVRVDRHFSPSLLRAIEKGAAEKDTSEKDPIKTERLGDTEFSAVITGPNTPDIRAICGRLNFQVRHLMRTRILNLSLGTLKEDRYRELSEPEQKAFLSSLGL